MITLFKSRLTTLFSSRLIGALELIVAEVAIAAIPIKKKIKIIPKATRLPKNEAKKLLKKLIIFSNLVTKIGFVVLFYEI